MKDNYTIQVADNLQIPTKYRVNLRLNWNLVLGIWNFLKFAVIRNLSYTIKPLSWILIILLTSIGGLKAQDIHYTQYELSPLTLNPALTGAYEGTFRVGGIYRDQWSSVLNNQYVTYSIYGDLPVIRGFGKNDWFGAGILLTNDRAGSALLNHTGGSLALSYHLGVGKKSNTVFSLGAQGGFAQKRVDMNELIFEDAIGGSTSAEFTNPNSTLDPSISYTDFNVGTLVNSYLTSRFSFYVGAAAFHITNPNDGFITEQKLRTRITAHGGFNYDLGNRLMIAPSFIFQTQAKARELVTQARLGYHINPERNVTLYGGLGYRYSGAAMALIGMDYKGAKLGIAYDIDVSPLNPASRGRGAYELALSYTAKIYKTPVVKPVLFCPRF